MSLLLSGEAEFLLYQSDDGQTRVEVRFDGDTAWLSLGQMAELFQRDKSVISRHVKNAFDEGELERSSVVADSATTAFDGKSYQVEYSNLDVIISVGYRVGTMPTESRLNNGDPNLRFHRPNFSWGARISCAVQ